MNIAIFGQHPDLKSGFNSTMTMNWIKSIYYSGKSNKITLYINDDFESERQFTRWDCDFDIVFIKKNESFSNAHDVIIWQTYHKFDHEKYWASILKVITVKQKIFQDFFLEYMIKIKRD